MNEAEDRLSRVGFSRRKVRMPTVALRAILDAAEKQQKDFVEFYHYFPTEEYAPPVHPSVASSS